MAQVTGTSAGNLSHCRSAGANRRDGRRQNSLLLLHERLPPAKNAQHAFPIFVTFGYLRLTNVR
jgi:hypothetical protein